MTSIEERLARDIAAVTGGIVVTDSDLRVAREAVDERLYGTRSRMRRGAVAVAAAAAVLGVVAATAFLVLDDDKQASQPADQGPDVNDPVADFLTGRAPTVDLVAGMWRVDNGHTVVHFSRDGQVRFDEHGTLFSHPTTSGSYVIAGDLITVTTTTDTIQSCVGTTYAMRASLPKAGDLRFVSSQSGFGACSPMPVGRGALEQVLPAAPSITGLLFSKDPGWTPLTDKTRLYGVWTAEGGGFVLEMDADGSYWVANGTGEPIDIGNWAFGGRDLTLTSLASSTACGQGDRLVLGAMQHQTPGTEAVRGTVTQNTCSAAWTPAAWILMPNADSS